MALEFLTESTHELVAYAEDKEAKISIENMPERFSYLGNRAYELENLTNETGCNITIDLGHVNTCKDQESYFKIPNILYNHINDNDGIKDKHRFPKGKSIILMKIFTKEEYRFKCKIIFNYSPL